MSEPLRPYQEAAIAALFEAWTTARRLLLVLPTGTGKTVVFARIAERLRPEGRVLVLAHREELIRQACDKIAAWTALSTDVEMGQERAAEFFGERADVIVASVQSLARRQRLGKFDPDAFGLVIIDEAHHAPADTYRRILDYFPRAKVLGVTATPDRLDKKALNVAFDAAPYIYEIRDAIGDGWLVPIRQRKAIIEGLDLSFCRTTAGDLNEGDLEAAMMKPAVAHGVAKATVEAAGPRKTLLFATTIAHAHQIAGTMGQYTDPARILALSGKDGSEDRREGLRRFASGEIQFLVNCLLFTEGFDQPDIACVAVARPTKSRALYAQMIGRGTRIAPDKADLLVVDFAGNAGKHELVNTLDVLGGADSPELRERVENLIAEGGDRDVLEALAQARKEMADFYRRVALEGANRARPNVNVRFVEIDPFAVLGVARTPGRWGGVEPTPADLEELRFHKVHLNMNLATLDRGEANDLLTAIKARRKKNLCTYRQARTLINHGYNPDVSFAEADVIIGRLAANGWRRPPDPPTPPGATP